MRSTSYSTRLKRILALVIAACLAIAGINAPAVADDAPQTGTVIVPVTIPADYDPNDVDDYKLGAYLQERIEIAPGEFEVNNFGYYETGVFDPASSIFTFTNVPLQRNIVVLFEGDWIGEEGDRETYIGGKNPEQAITMDLVSAGQTITFPTFSVPEKQEGTVIVPVTLPAGIDPTDVNEDTLYPTLYTRKLVDGEYTRKSLSSSHNFDDEATFDPTTSTFTYQEVPLANDLIVRLRGDLIETTYAGGAELADAIALNLTTPGSTITFPSTALTKSQSGTVYAPFTLPVTLDASELDSDEFEAKLVAVYWNASTGKYEEDGTMSYGRLDASNSRFVFEHIELNQPMAVVFEGSAIEPAIAGGVDIASAARRTLTADGQVVAFPSTTLIKQVYGTVRVPVVLPSGVVASDLTDYKFYADLYRRIWNEDDAFLDGGYYTSEAVHHNGYHFDHSKNEFVFTGIKKYDEIYADFGGSKSPDWYSGGRSMGTAQTVSITHDGQDVSFDLTDLSQVNRAPAKLVTFDGSFPEHIGLAYVRWELFDQDGKIVPEEWRHYTGSWETAEWQFKLDLDPNISGTYTVGLSTEHTGTFFPTADGGKTRDISKAQFLTLNETGATNFNAVDIVYPQDLAFDLLAIKGTAAPGKTVHLDHSAYPWKRIYSEESLLSWYPVVWEVADTEAGPWTPIGTGHSVTIPSNVTKQILRVSMSELYMLDTISAVTTISGLALKATSKPTISGTPAVKSTLKAKEPQWNTKPHKVTYQWLANGTAIQGATAAAHAVPESALGKEISVKVTATKPGFASVSVTSTPTAKIAAGAMTATKPVTITGTSRVASTLSAKGATWSQGGTSVKYQWNINGVAVKGATKTTFTVPSTAAGKTITVTATATKTGYATAKSTSSRTKTVAKSTATVSGKLAKTSIKKKKSTTITVTVKTPGITRPTGTATVKVGSKSVKAKIKSSHKGKIKITLKGSKLKNGKKQKVTVAFTPSGSTAKAVNKSKTTKISKTLTVAK